jgi:4-alpha-glucanotransferase
MVRRELGGLPFIAEDLGLITPDVSALRDEFQIPGSRVLQFAFDGASENPHLPQNHPHNSVVYTGTHDNDTTRGWFEALANDQKERVWAQLKRHGIPGNEIARDLVRMAWGSNSALAIAPLQDLLNLGPEARMNVPGTVAGNWSWRCTQDQLRGGCWESLRTLTAKSGRWPAGPAGRQPPPARGKPASGLGLAPADAAIFV